MVKTPPARAGDIRDPGSVPGSGRPTGGGHGKPLQHSCLENPMDRTAWWAAVHRVAKNRTELKQLSTQAHQRSREWNPRQVLRKCHGPSWDNLSKLIIMRSRSKRKLKGGVLARISREIEPIRCECVCVCVCVCVHPIGYIFLEDHD